jgi:hypothetical protein
MHSNATEDTALHMIATQLMAEKALGGSSIYQPFLDVLPDDISHMPALWPMDKLKQIVGTGVFEDAMLMQADWASRESSNSPGKRILPRTCHNLTLNLNLNLSRLNTNYTRNEMV